eukprot:m.142036 g.142036  ORF g.142036 m.142036 type:complete len:78 (+) comp16143_c0_seq33:1597-1830(+)
MDNKPRTDITAPNIMMFKSSPKRDDVTVVNTLNPTVEKTPEQLVKNDVKASAAICRSFSSRERRHCAGSISYNLWSH